MVIILYATARRSVTRRADVACAGLPETPRCGDHGEGDNTMGGHETETLQRLHEVRVCSWGLVGVSDR